jgi:histidinol-phosphatase
VTVNYQRELEVARAAAIAAGEAALAHQGRGVRAEYKDDLSPVTRADREGEAIISRALLEAFPGDGLLGEEGARQEGSSSRRWIIDPIDGTRDFLRGLPNWAVLIGLEIQDRVEAGVSYFPVQNTTYFAARGQGAWRDGERLRASTACDIGEALLCLNGFPEVPKLGFAPRLMEWLAGFWAVRSFGGCQDAVYVASGQAEIWIEPKGAPWDFAALRIIAEEAGAVFLNLDGGADLYAGNCALCAPGLERELRRFLACP